MSSIKAGTVADFADSMAAAMEKALSQEYENVKGEPMPDKPDQDRHLLFVAIAQGVVRYLKDNPDAFEISVETTQVTGEPNAPLIRSENPAFIDIDGGTTIDIGEAKVTQVIDDDADRVFTRGTATVNDIATTGVLY